jgi:hypothetical protein
MCTLALLGTALSVGGALAQGQQQKQMADYQARVYEQQALAEAQSTALDLNRERRKQDLLEAQARAQAGASGVGIAGSPTEVLAANARQGQVDLNTTRYSSQLRQNSLNDQAALSRFQGRQAMTDSIFKAGGSLIDGLSGLYNPSRSVAFGGSSLSPRASRAIIGGYTGLY